jgi:hypothetical protein
MTTIRSITFPLRLEGNNLATSTDADVVRNAIMHVLSIQPGEYLQRPTYGTPNRLFDSVQDVPDIVRDMENRLRNQVGADYPTVTFSCSGQLGEDGLLDIQVVWELAGTPQPTIALRL